MDRPAAINGQNALYTHNNNHEPRDHEHECQICFETFLYNTNPPQPGSPQPIEKRVVTSCKHTFHMLCFNKAQQHSEHRWLFQEKERIKKQIERLKEELDNLTDIKSIGAQDAAIARKTEELKRIEEMLRSRLSEIEKRTIAMASGDNLDMRCLMYEKNIDFLTIFPVDDSNANPGVQNNIGRAYELGLAVRRDVKAAAQWYRKAAEQGCAKAQNNLACLLLDEYKNSTEAVQWFTKAAEQGDSYACCNLFCLYKDGADVEQNDSLALYWCQKGAELGHSDCQYMMGQMYANGNEVDRNYDEAFICYKKAADQGHITAQNDLGALYENISKDYDKALTWYLEAAKGGHSLAQNNLGSLLLDVYANPAEAAEWFEKAAQRGDFCACYNLSLLYKDGIGVEQDDEKAEYWKKRSEELGSKDKSGH